MQQIMYSKCETSEEYEMGHIKLVREPAKPASKTLQQNEQDRQFKTSKRACETREQTL